MRLFVLGATGHSGTQILDLALARSHAVTAFTRSPEKITRRHPLLSVVCGYPHNVDPTIDITATRDVLRVWRSGVEFDRSVQQPR